MDIFVAVAFAAPAFVAAAVDDAADAVEAVAFFDAAAAAAEAVAAVAAAPAVAVASRQFEVST